MFQIGAPLTEASLAASPLASHAASLLVYLWPYLRRALPLRAVLVCLHECLLPIAACDRDIVVGLPHERNVVSCAMWVCLHEDRRVRHGIGVTRCCRCNVAIAQADPLRIRLRPHLGTTCHRFQRRRRTCLETRC